MNVGFMNSPQMMPPSASYNSVAHDMYRSAVRRGSLKRLASRFTRRPAHLDELDNFSCLASRHDGGVRMVPIEAITGSEGRASDFDRDFNPLSRHTKERWVRIAEARLKGESLPAVQLIKVGDIYYVRDGHHRISVSRALGQKTVDAEVIVWQGSDDCPIGYLQKFPYDCCPVAA